MSTEPKRKADAPGASSPVLEKHVAAAHAFDMLERQMNTLRERLEGDNRPKQQLYTVIATTLMASDLISRLLALQVALAGEV